MKEIRRSQPKKAAQVSPPPRLIVTIFESSPLAPPPSNLPVIFTITFIPFITIVMTRAPDMNPPTTTTTPSCILESGFTLRGKRLESLDRNLERPLTPSPSSPSLSSLALAGRRGLAFGCDRCGRPLDDLWRSLRCSRVNTEFARLAASREMKRGSELHHDQVEKSVLSSCVRLTRHSAPCLALTGPSAQDLLADTLNIPQRRVTLHCTAGEHQAYMRAADAAGGDSAGWRGSPRPTIQLS